MELVLKVGGKTLKENEKSRIHQILLEIMQQKKGEIVNENISINITKRTLGIKVKALKAMYVG